MGALLQAPTMEHALPLGLAVARYYGDLPGVRQLNTYGRTYLWAGGFALRTAWPVPYFTEEMDAPTFARVVTCLERAPAERWTARLDGPDGLREESACAWHTCEACEETVRHWVRRGLLLVRDRLVDDGWTAAACRFMSGAAAVLGFPADPRQPLQISGEGIEAVVSVATNGRVQRILAIERCTP